LPSPISGQSHDNNEKGNIGSNEMHSPMPTIFETTR